MTHPLAIPALALLLGALHQPAAGQEQARTERLTFTVDIETARAIGWVPESMDSSAALEGLTRLAGRRLELSSEGRPLRVSHGEQGRLHVDLGEGWSRESSDLLRGVVESWGTLEFRIIAEEDNAPESMDLAVERQRLVAWSEAHPADGIAAFNLVAAEEGGPSLGIEWYERRPTRLEPAVTCSPGGAEPERIALPLASPLLSPTNLQDDLGLAGMERLYRTADNLGFPAIGFQFTSSPAEAFSDFTERNKNRQLAIVVRGLIVSSPSIDDRLPGTGIIRGNFEPAEVEELLKTFRDPSRKRVFRSVSGR